VRIFLLCASLAVMLLLSVPAGADEAQDYIGNEINDWIGIANSDGYNVLGTYVGTVGAEEVVYNYELGPGVYHLYASGGLHISDLDVYIYDAEGIELGSDSLPDKIPIVVLKLAEAVKAEVRIGAFSFDEGYSSDYFCIVVTSEGEGEVRDFAGDTVDIEAGEPTGGTGGEISDDETYRQEAQVFLDSWLPMESETEGEIVDAGVVLATELAYRIDLALEPGFYRVVGQPDSRCMDLDMTVYDEEGNPLAEDHLEDNIPICEFYVLFEQNIGIDLEIYSLTEGTDRTYVAYMVKSLGPMDEESSRAYIEERLGWLQENADSAGEETIDSGIDTINQDENPARIEYEIDAGSYFCEVNGGMLLTDADLAVYDSDGNLLDEDTLADNYPMLWFELGEPETVAVDVTAASFVEGFDEAYYCWILTRTGEYSGGMTSWSGNDDELISSAQMLSEKWLAVVESHGEERIDSFTEGITQDDNVWRYDLQVGEGVYYIYGQGDDICLTDLDMAVYDEEGEMVDSDDLANNSPVCRVEAGTSGAMFRVEVTAIGLECEKGFFDLVIARGK